MQSFRRDIIGAAGLAITPLPVLHGGDYVAFAFEFGRRQRVVYMSDVSEIPEATERYLLGGRRIDVLVIDCLFIDKTHPTHFSKAETVAAIKKLRPRRAVLTGMCHEFDYHTHNEELKKELAGEDIEVEMGYDGLRVPVEL
eukprot:GDKI01041210.1.p1 GENE.GDKI01041210.1~~GDKI01041210.1.p1  ORF type:complete len:141 (-),score=38.11 GDKI01041210.1:144-566(-)